MIDSVGEHLKQGIEVEGFIRSDKEIEEHLSGLSHSPFNDLLFDIDSLLKGKLFKNPHFDTGYCTEIDLKAWDNLGDLADDFRNIIGETYNYCNKKHLKYMLIGVCPVSSFAGGHIHNSLYGSSDNQKEACGEIFRSLYPVQPFLTLLAQNSPLARTDDSRGVRHYSLSPIKDSRLQINGGCFARFQDTYNGRPSALAFSEHTTIEVRYPSSASIYQLLAQAVFIKACVFNRKMFGNIKEHDTKLMNICSQIITNGAPTGINLIYDKEKKMISIGRLLYKFINSGRFREGFRRALGELNSADQNKVMDIFSIFGTNRSITDFYYYLLKNKTSNVEGQCKLIHELGEREILKQRSIVRSVSLLPKKTIKTDLELQAKDCLMEELFGSDRK